jgi:DNA-directed RNA polymerase subunit RPC12/RpoP
MTKEQYIQKFGEPEYTNENCLTDTACPECGYRISFRIVAVTEFLVSDDGTESYSDVEWSDSSRITCRNCEHEGDIASFTIEGLDTP